MTTVLLVEDDPAARQGLELALRRLGYQVRPAETGEAGLNSISVAAVDVVVLDVMLPGLDGFEVCRRLRRSSDAAVIMLTARSDDFDIVGGLEAGADDTDFATAVTGCLRARGWTDVRTDVPAGLTVRLDRRRFDVIIANLVGNALRHGGPPVTVTATAEPHGRGSGQLAVEVRDHGPGLPPAAIAHVFDRFYKADTARARSEGSGLGLAIAAENARLHGGHIEAGNHPGGGAVFTVTLPGGRNPALGGMVAQAVPAGR